MKFEIHRAANGAILRVETDAPDAQLDEVVYQEREDDEVEAFAEFLRHLLEHYGPVTNRYSAKRIHIVVEPGDKYTQPEDATPSGLEAGWGQRTSGKVALDTHR